MIATVQHVVSPDSEASGVGLLDLGVGLSLSILVAVMVSGIGAAAVGAFDVVVVTITGLVGGLILWIPLLRLWEKRGRRMIVHGADVVVLVAAALWIGFNVPVASQHVFSDRDPGVYLNTGRFLAESPELVLDIAPGILQESDGSNWLWGFFDDRGDGKLTPQFLDGLPVLLAVAWSVGGAAGIFLAPVLLSGLAILALYLCASVVVSRPWSAVAALSLGVNLVFVHFARDTYSETLALPFLLGGVWLVSRALDRPALGFFAGAVFAAALSVRIDAWLALTGPLSVAVAVWWSQASDDRRRRKRALVATAAGGIVMAAVGLVDLIVLSPTYWGYQGGRVVQILAVLAVLGLTAAIGSWNAVKNRLRSWFPRSSRSVADVAAGVLTIGAVWLWLIRPFGSPVRAGSLPQIAILLAAEGHVPETDRTLAEMSGVWLWWYLGPMVVAGVIGLIVAARETVISRDPRWVLVLGFVLPSTALYLWKPTITPDQLWAMRRYLPVVMPGLIIAGVWIMARAVSRIRSGWASRAATIAAVVIALVPGARLAPVASAATTPGAYDFLVSVCDALPARAALFAGGDGQTRLWAPPLRTFCGAPVVVGEPEQLAALMVTARDDGYDVLWYGPGCETAVETVFTYGVGLPILERTVMRPPAAVEPEYYEMTILRPGSDLAECAGVGH